LKGHFQNEFSFYKQCIDSALPEAVLPQSCEKPCTISIHLN
jgi:hypothetical protein